MGEGIQIQTVAVKGNGNPPPPAEPYINYAEIVKFYSYGFKQPAFEDYVVD